MNFRRFFCSNLRVYTFEYALNIKNIRKDYITDSLETQLAVIQYLKRKKKRKKVNIIETLTKNKPVIKKEKKVIFNARTLKKLKRKKYKRLKRRRKNLKNLKLKIRLKKLLFLKNFSKKEKKTLKQRFYKRRYKIIKIPFYNRLFKNLYFYRKTKIHKKKFKKNYFFSLLKFIFIMFKAKKNYKKKLYRRKPAPYNFKHVD